MHLALVALLMLIFPFSKLLHAPGVFFSPTRNQVDDPRERRHLAPLGRAARPEDADDGRRTSRPRRCASSRARRRRSLPGAMAASKPYVATDKMQQALGFPGELADGWQEKAIGKMGELLGKYRSLKVYLDACVHCGACADKCHYFIGTQDPLNMPVARQDLMRSVYRRTSRCPASCSRSSSARAT